MSNTYTIKSGDVLGRIANTTGVSIETLMSLNDIKDANKIQAGQVLRLDNTVEKPTTSLSREFTLRERQIAKLINENVDAPPHAKAGFMGHVRQEAGANLAGDTRQLDDSGNPLLKGAEFILQLEQAEDARGYLNRTYKRWVKESNLDLYDVGTQFEFFNAIINEPNHYVNQPFYEPDSKYGSRKYGRTFGGTNRKRIKEAFNSNNITNIVDSLHTNFFMSGKSNIDKRYEHAKFYLPLFLEEEEIIIDE